MLAPVKGLADMYRAASRENHRVILDTLVPRPGATLLDLGCGPGTVTMQVAERVGAGRVLGVELMDELAAKARARGVEVTSADLGQPLLFDDASIDVVHSNQVIEHLNDTDLFLREIQRVLRPGGYAVLSTNNLSSWHNIVSLLFGWQPPPCHCSDEFVAGSPASRGELAHGVDIHPMHRRIFTGKALAAVAVHHGLTVEATRGSGYYPFPDRVSALLARLDPRHAVYLVHRYGRPL
jgi:SAM-dependent methyltransferase